jgi:hypothetical protein
MTNAEVGMVNGERFGELYSCTDFGIRNLNE